MQMWKQNRTLFEYFRFMGYLMMIVGVYLLVGGIGDYAEQSSQNDWISTEATVTDVSSEVVSSSPPHSSSTTYYIMAYAYVVDGEIYTGSTGRTSSPRMVGTAITVKYNPGAPEENTATLSHPQSGSSSDFRNGHRSGGLFPLWGAGATSQPSAKDAHRGAEEIGSGDRHRV